MIRLLTRFFLYAKYLSEPKYQFLIKHLNDPKAFVGYSNTMDDVYNIFDNCNPKRNTKVLIVFDEIITDTSNNKNFQAIVKELFIRCKKLNIYLVFITQSYFLVPKEVRLNSTYYLIMRLQNKRELQNIAINHSADIGYKDFMMIYRRYTSNPYSFLTIGTTLPADNSLCLKKNLY